MEDSHVLDFAALRREERRRAKEQKQKQNKEPKASSASLRTNGENGVKSGTMFKMSSDSAIGKIKTDNHGIGDGSGDGMGVEMEIVPSTSTLEEEGDNESTPWADSKPSPQIASIMGIEHRVGSIPSVYYFPHFLPEAFIQSSLIPFLKSSPSLDGAHHGSNPKEEYKQSLGKWTQLKHARRRVMMLDDTLQPFPQPINMIIELMITFGVLKAQGIPPNHVLINEYQAGEGIMPHTDGPEYESQTATISIGGSDVLMKFLPRLKSHEVGRKPQDPELEVLLEGNGSLLLFREDAYLEYCHTISETEQETASHLCCNAPVGTNIHRGHRISLTFRTKKNGPSAVENLDR